MSCCRGRKKVIKNKQPPACSELDKYGSSYKLWPTVTDTGIVISVKIPDYGFITLASFLSAYKCHGPVASLLIRNISHITNLPAKKLYNYTRTGITIGQLLKLIK